VSKSTLHRLDAALNKLSTVHFARFVFLQNRTQLAIITEYDGDFADYISDFAIHIGDVFDAALVNGAPGYARREART